MGRLVVVFAIAVALAVSGAIGFVRQTPDPAPAVAVADSEDLASLGSQDLGDVVAGLQARLSRLPEDDGNWATLALAYVEQGRVTGDPSSYPKAEKAVRRSLDLQPRDNAAALSAASALAAAKHDFSESLDLADRALAIDSFEAGALNVRVDALTELGRYDDQLAALRTADKRQPGVPVFARYSYAFELRGELGRASSVLERAIPSASHEEKGFLLTLQADIDRRRGLLDDAEEHLDLALRENPDHIPAMVSRARLAVARGDLEAAEQQWLEVVSLLPLPEYLTELGELYTAGGEDDLAQAQYDVVEATNELLSRNGVNTDLESAIYSADHGAPEQALAGARAEWDRRKSIHVADALAWALHANGRDREALPLARKATRLDTPEARLWIHRGTIEAALGLEDAARTHLRRGLATDAGLSPWQAARARAVLSDLGGRG